MGLITMFKEIVSKKTISTQEMHRMNQNGLFVGHNITTNQLEEGAKRQWQRLTDRNFQAVEFTQKLNRLRTHK